MSPARETTLKDSDREHFRKQASCLGFSREPDFTHDPNNGASPFEPVGWKYEDVWQQTELISPLCLSSFLRRRRGAYDIWCNFHEYFKVKRGKCLKTSNVFCLFFIPDLMKDITCGAPPCGGVGVYHEPAQKVEWMNIRIQIHVAVVAHVGCCYSDHGSGAKTLSGAETSMSRMKPLDASNKHPMKTHRHQQIVRPRALSVMRLIGHLHLKQLNQEPKSTHSSYMIQE